MKSIRHETINAMRWGAAMKAINFVAVKISKWVLSIWKYFIRVIIITLLNNIEKKTIICVQNVK